MKSDRLISLLKEKNAILEGHFLLTSGKHSNFYIEKFKILKDPTLLSSVCDAMAI